MDKFIKMIFLIGLVIICLLTRLDIIGGINRGLNPKKFKKIDISKKKIFVPFHRRHFFKKIKGYKPEFDGSVFKITYILTLCAYFHFVCSLIFLALYAFFWNALALILFVCWDFLFSCIISTIDGLVTSSFRRRLKDEGPDFKI